jgi:predicted metalloendopeptidase
MRCFCRALRIPLALSFLCVALFCATATAQNTGIEDPDRSIKPGDDFYRYANDNWLSGVTLPAGQSTYDTRTMMSALSKQRVLKLDQRAAAARGAEGSIEQKVGDYYASFIDTGGIESKGLRPLANERAAIDRIADRNSLSAYLGTTLNSETDGITANGDHVFGIWINQGFEDAQHNVPHIWQGGLGLADRDNYLDESPKATELRAQYKTHIAALLRIAGIRDSIERASQILLLETRIAQAFAPDADAADVSKQNNSWKREDFAAKAPGIEWRAYFKAAGLDGQSDFVVWQPSAVTGVSALVATEPIGVWKDYLTFHLIQHYSSILPKAVRDEQFAFFGKLTSGAPQESERTDDAMTATNAAIGQAVGQLYIREYFSKEAKAKAQEMAANLIAAFRSRISNLTWMSPETKEKALAKLAALKVIVGYPDQWIDYSTLDVVRGDAAGNMRRAEAFNRRRNLARLKAPVDPIDWPLNPQTPGAVIMFSPNAEFFSAGILQPPYFGDDAASSYGSAGAGMAHELSHSFDELGNIYDAQGRISHWWTSQDKTQFDAVSEKLIAQLNADCPFPDLCVNGKQVLTETVADLAGLLVAHDAYILSLKGKIDTVIQGLTGEQRFFLAFAQRWRKIQSNDALRHQVRTDTHVPGPFRSALVRNVDAWYSAFDVNESNKLYLKPEDRIRIW